MIPLLEIRDGFEEEIAQGQDMIRRLEAESRLSLVERDALPPHRRVPRTEALAWQDRVEAKLQSAFGPDTFARYRIAWDLYKEELDDDIGNEYSRTLNAWNRIVALLEELNLRQAGHSPP